MAKGGYVGVGGKARKLKKGYIGVGGIARKLKKGYIGVDGIARATYTAESVWQKYSCNEARHYAKKSQVSETISTVTHQTNDPTSYYSGYTFSETEGYRGTGEVLLPPLNSKGKYTGIFSPYTYVRQVADVKQVNEEIVVYAKYVAEASISYIYSKGDVSYGEVIADESSLPEEGTLIRGSIDGDYCVISVNGTKYYYEKA